MLTDRIATRAGDIGYRTAGDGPPLILLHGFTQDSRIWRPQLEELADTFRVIAWDAPGCGISYDPPSEFTIADWVRELDGFMKALGIGNAHVLGLSWGGLLAQEFYAQFPQHVTSLILADTYAGWTGSLSAEIAAKRLAACERDSLLAPEEFVPLYLPGMLSSTVSDETRRELEAVMLETHPLGFRLMAAALAHADTRALLPKIAVPTLLVWGDLDARSPLPIGQEMNRLIPGSRLIVLPGAGHVSNLEKPREFTAGVKSFLLA